MDNKLTTTVRDAQTGDKAALEHLVSELQNHVHHLAVRMLVDRDDALDATQEILILVITKLSTFRGDSSLNTWVYRIATNYLLTAKKVAERERGLTFELFAADLKNGLVADPVPVADDVVMLNELRISCTLAMLLCLDQKHRITYVLGDILDFEHSEATEILGISKDNFRQRLSRARAKVVAFTSSNCGLANENAKWSCPRRLPAAKAQRRVSAGTYSDYNGPAYNDVLAQAKKVEGELKVLKLQTATPLFKCPQDFGAHIAQIVEGRT